MFRPKRLSWIFDRHGIALLSSRLLGGLGMRRPPGTLVARALDVVVRGHRRKQPESAFAQLLGAAQDDLGASVVVLDRSLDFNPSAFELANVAHLFEIGREHDHGEGTRLGVFAEVEERNAFAAIFHVQHGSADALGRAHMLARFGEGDAVMRGSIARGANVAHRENGSEQENHSEKAHYG